MKKLALFLALMVPATGCYGFFKGAKEKLKAAAAATGVTEAAKDFAQQQKEAAKGAAITQMEKRVLPNRTSLGSVKLEWDQRVEAFGQAAEQWKLLQEKWEEKEGSSEEVAASQVEFDEEDEEAMEERGGVAQDPMQAKWERANELWANIQGLWAAKKDSWATKYRQVLTAALNKHADIGGEVKNLNKIVREARFIVKRADNLVKQTRAVVFPPQTSAAQPVAAPVVAEEAESTEEAEE